MEMVRLTIDGVQVKVPKGTTVLEAARSANIQIPTLCYLKGINEIGACRMCLVEVKGARNLQASCVYPAADGMEVRTNSPAVREARRINLELILSNHDRKCLTCVRSENCELQALSKQLGVDDIRFDGEKIDYAVDEFSPSIVRDPNKCILCRRCVAACREIQGIGAIGATERGFRTIVEPIFGKNISEVNCINCGQCIEACGRCMRRRMIPTGYGMQSTTRIFMWLYKLLCCSRSSGREFGMPIEPCNG